MKFARFCLSVMMVVSVGGLARAADGPPNIVYILADDMGVGDVGCLNPGAKVKTPNLDRLAGEGMRFTDAHSASAVCTPTRYGILTGRYPWRTRLKKGVLGGFSPPLIEEGRLTVPGLLKQHGYRTAALGKWHLGMDWPGAEKSDAIKAVERVDYTKPIGRGPTTVGFDYFYGISASLDMPPYVWIENERTVGLPTATKKWIREGPAHPDFEAVDVLPTLAKRAAQYIGESAAGGKPFFLYVPLASPHTPIVPGAPLKGKSGVSEYLDFVMETDWAVGQVMEALEKAGVAQNTLIIFTADNGCSPAAGIPILTAAGHDPSAGRRGTKADLFEGGHRVPFIARWPAKVKAGAVCDDVICLNDLMATAAEVVGAKLPADAGEDSVSILPDLVGTAKGPVREAVVHASIDGSLAIRQGRWKLLRAPGSGGWSAPKAPKEVAGLPKVQLYDLQADPGETKNLHLEHAEVVDRLGALLVRYEQSGRSTAVER